MREMDVKILQAGYCKHPQIMSIKDGTFKPVIYPSLVMLITHPVEGLILFDTGYDPAFIQATQPFPERFYRWTTPVTLRDGEDIASQLRNNGHELTEVRHVILSHFHADHMSGIHAFPNARIHCAKAGLNSACDGGRLKTVRHGILKALIPVDIDHRARFFEEGPQISLPRDFFPFETGSDILGDGSIIAIELPGHCPGHWGIAVKGQAGQYHFMVADAAWSSDAIRRNVPPPAISSGFLGSTQKVRKTLTNLNQLWRRNADIKITPTHCPECAKKVDRL